MRACVCVCVCVCVCAIVIVMSSPSWPVSWKREQQLERDGRGEAFYLEEAR
jgi:hypothetical protein